MVSKKRRRLLPFVPSAEMDKRLEQMRSLAVALKALKMRFSDSLTYVPGMAPRSANAAKMEKGGMQVLVFSYFLLGLIFFSHIMDIL